MFTRIGFDSIAGIAIPAVLLMVPAVTGAEDRASSDPDRVLINDVRINDDAGTANQ